MKTVSISTQTLSPLLGAVLAASLISGCGSSDTAPPPAAMAPRTVAPPASVPSSQSEKIAAIEKSAMSPAEKKAAIQRVQSGTL